MADQLRAAAQRLLDAVEDGGHKSDVMAAADALRAALAQAEPVQPVAWVDERAISWLAGRRNKASAHVTTTLSAAKSLERPMALYTAQQQAEPVGAVLVNRESREGVMFYSVDMIPDPATLKDRFELVKVYTAPLQRKPLTDDQLDDIAVAARSGNLYDLRIAIERAHGIKEKA